MLPQDIENLIMEFHDSYETCKKRMHINMIIKSGFKEFEQNESKEYYLNDVPHGLEWYRLMFNIHRYDKRMVKINQNNTCYSQLWDGCVPWD